MHTGPNTYLGHALNTLGGVSPTEAAMRWAKPMRKKPNGAPLDVWGNPILEDLASWDRRLGTELAIMEVYSGKVPAWKLPKVLPVVERRAAA